MYPAETFQPMSISSIGRPIARLPPHSNKSVRPSQSNPTWIRSFVSVLLNEPEEIVGEGEDVDDPGGHPYLVSPEHAPPGLVGFVHEDEEVEARDDYLHQPGPNDGLQHGSVHCRIQQFYKLFFVTLAISHSSASPPHLIQPATYNQPRLRPHLLNAMKPQ